MAFRVQIISETIETSLHENSVLSGTGRDAASICALEPIHIPGTIQPHGVLLSVDPANDFTLVAISANASKLIASIGEIDALLGNSVLAIFGWSFMFELQERFETGRLRGAAPWQSTLHLPEEKFAFDTTVHYQDGLIHIELEHMRPDENAKALEASRNLQECLVDLQEAHEDLFDLAHVAARGIRRLLGYERVVIYRFDAEWDGVAIAEDKIADWDQSLAGLRFPASDIPAQARELYRWSRKRWVPDRDARPAALMLASPSTGRPIDLSFARLRSLSPVHLQYHKNMGVNGSMSLSIMNGNILWGLVNCHHRAIHYPSAGQRVAAAVLTDAFSLQVGPAERANNEQSRRQDLSRLAKLLTHTAEAENVISALTSGDVTIADLFASTGAAIFENGAVSILGRAPAELHIRALAAWLRAKPPNGKMFHTDNLAAVFPVWEPQAAIASGLLAVFLSDDRSDMLLWFRPEEAQLVAWGGNPYKDNSVGTSILPRESFERWVDTKHNVSKPWLEWELEIAESLRHGITDVIIRGLRRISELNDRLRQSQKMEAVGQLTGGIAHDFNNLLAGISGNLELTASRLEQGRLGDIKQYVASAMSSVARAASLTHRLLAFSRRQTLDPNPINVEQLATGMVDLISQAVGPGIQIETVFAEDLWATLCDGNQLENALLNLAINARDAMPDGGRLVVEAANLALDEAYAGRFHEVAAGEYVAVSVTDTGVGMEPDVLAHVFEPFFTTKPLGSGTGLGLSMVYGFTKQSNGYTGIYSEPGHGTTVRLYLPRYVGAAALDGRDSERQTFPNKSAHADDTILVVDDDAVVRMLVCEVLTDLGYAAIEATDGTQGLAILQSKQRVELLITDVGLPGGMNGRQLADAARVHRPELKVLFITGYAENAALGNGVLEAGMQVMTKPFGLESLAFKIQAMM